MAIKYIDQTQISEYPTTGAAGSPVAKTNYQLWLESQLANGGGVGAGSAGDPSSYMGQAGSMLGALDTSGFGALKKALEAQYATGSQGLQNSYQNLLATLTKQGTENKQQFAKARGTIAENSFERGRDQFRALASRGLAASGLQQLGEVQNRMQTGREVSGVANQYYDTAEGLAQSQVQGQQGFETQKQNLANSLASGQASIGQQEIQYKSSYQQSLANLAMQLQSTKQSQLNAAASAAASERNYQASIGGELAKLKDAAGSTVDPYGTAKVNIVSQDIPEAAKLRLLQSEGNLSAEAAQAYLATYKADVLGPVAQDTADKIIRDSRVTQRSAGEIATAINQSMIDGYEMTDAQKQAVIDQAATKYSQQFKYSSPAVVAKNTQRYIDEITKRLK